MPSGTLHLLIGPVGAGKTTYAERRVARSPAVFLDLDACMVRLYGDDARPADGVMAWYLARRDRCRALLWDLALQTLACDTDVLLELGLVTAADREQICHQAEALELPLHVYLLDAPREVRRARVAARNLAARPFTQLVPPPFFELASDAWEPPTAAEHARWNIVDV